MFKKITGWFRTREVLRKIIAQLKDHNSHLDRLLNYKIDLVLKTIEELDQEKVYYMKVETEEDLISVKEFIKRASALMKWTMPRIIFFSSEFGESKEKIKKNKQSR